MPNLNYFSRPSLLKDLKVIALVNLTLFIVFINYDVLEWVYDLSRRHEHLELDEIIPLAASLALSLLWFSYRRIVELGEITQAFEHLSMRDPLTGVLNRRAGQLSLLTYQENMTSDKHTYSLLQLNLDNFNQLNALFGSTIGDEVLTATARLLEKELPAESILIRWLDDNFLILLPDLSINAFELSNNIVINVAQNVMGPTYPVTCSVGLTQWTKPQELNEALDNVEEALISAKEAGGNGVKTCIRGLIPIPLKI